MLQFGDEVVKSNNEIDEYRQLHSSMKLTKL
jgi:hypothetical protein